MHLVNTGRRPTQRKSGGKPSMPDGSVVEMHDPQMPAAPRAPGGSDWAGSEGVAAVWVRSRNCVDVDPNVFFPNDGAGVIAAQRVCSNCTVKEMCREYALSNNITHGVWGGTSERQRRRILRDRRRELKAARLAAATHTSTHAACDSCEGSHASA